MLEGTELKKALQAIDYNWAAESLNHPSNFGYHGDLDLFNTWGSCFTLEHRDSNTLDQSNSATIKQLIKDNGLEDDFEVCNFNHWAVGWAEQLAIRLATEDGINHEALTFWQSILDSLENYPVLDEDDYYNREYEDFIDTLGSCYKWDLENEGYILPDDWVSQVAHELDYSSSEEIKMDDLIEAAESLGFSKE
jgi:hypothetical protein